VGLFWIASYFMSVSKQEFRTALGHFASAVTVVTAKCGDGRLAGITVTAFSSLSLEPPLVLICIDKRAFLHGQLQPGGCFAVNILGQSQESLSRRFAASDPDQFAGIGYTTGIDGVPLLDDVLAVVECRIATQHDGGDHTIFVGQVEATRVTDGKPLLYYRGGYGQMA
jgi:flavin reductase (DIM6/NTAB) family NADH-FMN oxidoreductase RutF